MADRKSHTKSRTLSVGESAKRLDVSPDTIRNYCERGWLKFMRLRGHHRRILLESIESFEAQRRPAARDSGVQITTAPRQSRPIDEDFEIYYLGNENFPNEYQPGYICNLSFFVNMITSDVQRSLILNYVGIQFGGGNFRLVRVRDAEVVSERYVSLPGSTKGEVLMMREMAMDN
jgi:excisionase family DNA binding protein